MARRRKNKPKQVAGISTSPAYQSSGVITINNGAQFTKLFVPATSNSWTISSGSTSWWPYSEKLKGIKI